ncbi:MAG: class I SAM-dependent methyltransferase [Acidimicrobiia bacterium]
MKLVAGPPPDAFRESIARTYDGVAAVRDERGEEDWRWPIAERFLEILHADGRESMLEIGAGVGYTSRWFADRGITVTATDLSPEHVALCRAKGLEAHVRDMYDLGFAPATFASAWAMNCIHHIPNADLPRVLAGIAGVVHPGSPVYIGVWGGVDEEGLPEEDFYQPPRFFSFRADDTLQALLEKAFLIESFETFKPGDDAADVLHMQSAFLRTR